MLVAMDRTELRVGHESGTYIREVPGCRGVQRGVAAVVPCVHRDEVWTRHNRVAHASEAPVRGVVQGLR